MKKHIEKTVDLEYQSNLRFEGLLEDDNETWDKTEAKVKNALVEKLDFKSAPEMNVLIAQAALRGKMELQNREGSFVSLQVIKQKRQFLRGQGESNPKSEAFLKTSS